MRFLRNSLTTLATVLFAAFMGAACVVMVGDGDAGGEEAGEGQLRLVLLDAPIDEADAVYVTVDEVAVHYLGADGSGSAADDAYDDDSYDDDTDDDTSDDDAADDDATDDDAADDDNDSNGPEKSGLFGNDEPAKLGWITLDITPTRFNLFDLMHDAGEIIADQALPAGHYNQIRIKIACTGDQSPSIVIGGHEEPLTVPSGCSSGIKIPYEFTIRDASDTWLLADFDVRKSIHETGDGYYSMNPVIRVVDRSKAGRLAGEIQQNAPATVYVLPTGTLVKNPDEDAVSSTFPREDGSFIIPALPVGTYDILVTADGYEDLRVQDVAVSAGGTAQLGTLDLGLPETTDDDI